MRNASPSVQSRLAELAAERAQWVTGREQGTRHEPDAGTADTTVLVLLREFNLTDLVHGARKFAAALDAAEGAAWRRSWTRTRFLFGNPANLTPLNRARVLAPGATAAWLGPFPVSRRLGLSRLLKPVIGKLPELPREVHIPGTGPQRELHIAVAGLTLADYLVHLHHTLAEAVLLERLRPDEPLRLCHRPTLEPGYASDSPAYARVLPEPGDTGRLRLHTRLSSLLCRPQT